MVPHAAPGSGDHRAQLGGLARLVWFSAHSSRLMRTAFGGRAHSNLQMSAVFALVDTPGISPTELAATLAVHPASVSRVLRALASSGVVRMSPDDADARKRHVWLTATGERVLDDFMLGLGDLVRGPEVTGIPALLGVPEPPPGAAPAFPDALGRLVELGSRADAAMSRGLGAAGPASGLGRWVVIGLHARAVEPRPAPLASWLGVARSTVSAHLNQLEEGGLVRRLPQQVSGDGREVELVLTGPGRHAGTVMLAAFHPFAVEFGEAVAEVVRASHVDRRERAASHSTHR